MDFSEDWNVFNSIWNEALKGLKHIEEKQISSCGPMDDWMQFPASVALSKGVFVTISEGKTQNNPKQITTLRIPDGAQRNFSNWT